MSKKPKVILEWKDEHGSGWTYRLVRQDTGWEKHGTRLRYYIEHKESDCMDQPLWVLESTINPGKEWWEEEGEHTRRNRLLIAALVERDVRRSRRRRRRKA